MLEELRQKKGERYYDTHSQSEKFHDQLEIGPEFVFFILFVIAAIAFAFVVGAN